MFVIVLLIKLVVCLMQVACALLMAGEDLEKHTNVKDILIEMGTYFQVQVSLNAPCTFVVQF